MKKREPFRAFPPDYVSAETLAYRLDCTRSTIDEYVRDGILPKPEVVGTLIRWDFDKVRAAIAARNEANLAGSELDPYFEGIKRAAQATH